MIELSIDAKSLHKQLQPLLTFPQAVQPAVYQSLKKTMTGIRAEAGREIRARAALAPGRVSQAIGKVVITGGASRLEGSIRVASEGQHLGDYQITPRRRTAVQGVRSSRWRTVRWRVERGRGFKENAPEDGFSKAFAAYAKSGKLVLFRRGAGGKLKALFGPRIQYFMAFDSVQEHLQTTARERFERTLAHEVQYRLGKTK